MVYALATQRRVRRNRHRWRKTASGRQHYNYFRDYDPSTGRYLQSDPIGLAGGISTYLYADANSLDRVDVYGLNAVSPTSFPTFGAENVRWSREPSLQGIEQQRLGSAAHCASNPGYCRTPVDDLADAYVDFMATSCPVAGVAGLKLGKFALRSRVAQRICLASGLGAAACAGKFDDIREVFGDVQRRLEVRQEVRRGTQIENRIKNSISTRPDHP
jgi:RHS repeat-associated protein